MSVFVSHAFTAAGATISIGAAPSTYDLTGFGAVSFTNIGEVTDIGEFGKTYKLVTHQPLAARNTVKRKGSFDSGKMTLKMAHVPGDAGQAALITARDSDASYSFKVVLQSGEIAYFTAQVMGYMTTVGTVDQIVAASMDIEIDNEVLTA